MADAALVKEVKLARGITGDFADEDARLNIDIVFQFCYRIEMRAIH